MKNQRPGRMHAILALVMKLRYRVASWDMYHHFLRPAEQMLVYVCMNRWKSCIYSSNEAQVKCIIISFCWKMSAPLWRLFLAKENISILEEKSSCILGQPWLPVWWHLVHALGSISWLNSFKLTSLWWIVHGSVKVWSCICDFLIRPFHGCLEELKLKTHDSREA